MDNPSILWKRKDGSAVRLIHYATETCMAYEHLVSYGDGVAFEVRMECDPSSHPHHWVTEQEYKKLSKALTRRMIWYLVLFFGLSVGFGSFVRPEWFGIAVAMAVATWVAVTVERKHKRIRGHHQTELTDG